MTEAELIERCAKALTSAPFPSGRSLLRMRQALEATGIPLSVLAALVDGRTLGALRLLGWRTRDQVKVTVMGRAEAMYEDSETGVELRMVRELFRPGYYYTDPPAAAPTQPEVGS